MNVEIIEYREDYIKPSRKHGIDVGMDIAAPDDGVLQPGPNSIALGFGLKVPVGYNVSVYPRTSMVSGKASLELELDQNTSFAAEQTLLKEVSPGVCILAMLPPIDPGYTGEIHALVYNTSSLRIKYKRGTRFGQLVCHPITYMHIVKDVNYSRDDGWEGSTGIK